MPASKRIINEQAIIKLKKAIIKMVKRSFDVWLNDRYPIG